MYRVRGAQEGCIAIQHIRHLGVRRAQDALKEFEETPVE
jgi:hypothetical protein